MEMSRPANHRHLRRCQVVQTYETPRTVSATFVFVSRGQETQQSSTPTPRKPWACVRIALNQSGGSSETQSFDNGQYRSWNNTAGFICREQIDRKLIDPVDLKHREPMIQKDRSRACHKQGCRAKKRSHLQPQRVFRINCLLDRRLVFSGARDRL